MKTITAIAFVLVSIVTANAETATPAWNDVLRTCSAEYRERADKTEKGTAVWQSFLNECKARKGFVSKKDAARADFVRVPDKTTDPK